jgi:hypothetical protein
MEESRTVKKYGQYRRKLCRIDSDFMEEMENMEERQF